MIRRSATILVVDDDPNDLILIRAAFRAVQITSTIHAVESGSQAIAYLTREGKYADQSLFPYPDFVMTDLKMPGVDGFALLKFLRQNPESAIVPVAVLSGSSDSDDIRRAYRLGANSYHIKPSGPTDLRALVNAVHAHWMVCEVPEVDSGRRELPAKREADLGEKFFYTAST